MWIRIRLFALMRIRILHFTFMRSRIRRPYESDSDSDQKRDADPNSAPHQHDADPDPASHKWYGSMQIRIRKPQHCYNMFHKKSSVNSSSFFVSYRYICGWANLMKSNPACGVLIHSIALSPHNRTEPVGWFATRSLFEVNNPLGRLDTGVLTNLLLYTPTMNWMNL
jgi:hypothetical protein